MSEWEANIYVPQNNIAVVSGSTAVLECIPYGTPLPTIVWSKVRLRDFKWFLNDIALFLNTFRNMLICYHCWILMQIADAILSLKVFLNSCYGVTELRSSCKLSLI